MFKKIKDTFKFDKKAKPVDSPTKGRPDKSLQKSGKKVDQNKTYETLVISEEMVELFEHRITHWENDVIVSDIRKLMARPSETGINQKIVVTEKMTIPEQSLVVPIKVNKSIRGKPQDSSIVGIPVKILQMDVPVIESVEVIDVPIRTSIRTTQLIQPIGKSDEQL